MKLLTSNQFWATKMSVPWVAFFTALCLDSKTKLNLPASHSLSDTHGSKWQECLTPLRSCTSPRSPKDLTSSYEPTTMPSGLVLIVWLSHLPGLSITFFSNCLIPGLKWGPLGWVPCLKATASTFPAGPTLGTREGTAEVWSAGTNSPMGLRMNLGEKWPQELC